MKQVLFVCFLLVLLIGAIKCEVRQSWEQRSSLSFQFSRIEKALKKRIEQCIFVEQENNKKNGVLFSVSESDKCFDKDVYFKELIDMDKKLHDKEEEREQQDLSLRDGFKMLFKLTFERVKRRILSDNKQN